MTSPNIVFLVGADRCGKTEIAKALSKVLNVPYYKASTERRAFVNDQGRFINDIRWSCPARLDLLKQIMQQCYLSGIVFDRGAPDEWVYSRFFERDRDDAAVMFLDEEYAKLNACIVMPFRSSYEGYADDLNPILANDNLLKLENLYRDYSKITKCRFLALNVDDENLNREIATIMNFLRSKNE